MVDTIRFTESYVRRAVDKELDDLFHQLPAVLLDGPKGVGKTTTALERCKTARNLDNPAEREVLEADPSVIARDEPPVLIDEWQRVPAVFDAIRREVDRNPTGGRFLLAGSAPTTATHSGAGRISTIRMRPLALFERIPRTPAQVSFGEILSGQWNPSGRCSWTLDDYVNEITASGYPAMRQLEGRALDKQLSSYLDRIVDHDLIEAGFHVRRPETVRAWLRAYASATGTTTSLEKIRNATTSGSSSPPAKTTIQTYVELLKFLRVLDPIDGWIPSNNHLSNLMTSPKHYLADPALSARLVRLSATRLMKGAEPAVSVPRDGAFLGCLFEALVALSIRTIAQVYDGRTYHLRTHRGRREVDFIVETPHGIVAVESKLGANVDAHDVRHLVWLKETIGDECIDAVVVNTGPEAYRREDGVAVLPLALLGV